MAVLIDRRAENYSMNGIAIFNCVGEALEKHHAGAFAAHETIRRRIERGASAIGREHRRLRKADESPGCDYHSHAASECGVAASGPNVLARGMDCSEGGRTRSVQRHARTSQIQTVGNSIRGD